MPGFIPPRGEGGLGGTLVLGEVDAAVAEGVGFPGCKAPRDLALGFADIPVWSEMSLAMGKAPQQHPPPSIGERGCLGYGPPPPQLPTVRRIIPSVLSAGIKAKFAVGLSENGFSGAI